MSSRYRSSNDQDWEDNLDLPRWDAPSEDPPRSPEDWDEAGQRTPRSRGRAPYPESPQGSQRRRRDAGSRRSDPARDPRYSEEPEPRRSRLPLRRTEVAPPEATEDLRPSRASSRRAPERSVYEPGPEEEWDALDQPRDEETLIPPGRRSTRREPARETASRQRRAEPSRRARTAPRVSVTKPTVPDGALAAVGGVALLSIVAMAITMAARIGDLPDTIPLHLNASGNPDLWGSPSALWRIPLAVVMSLTMSLVIAVFLWKRDPFAARFAIGSTVLIQILAWVAVVDALW
jgi:hypothetical protein